MNVWESIDFVSQWAKDQRDKLGLSQADIAGRASALMEAAGSRRSLKQQNIDQFEKKMHKGVPDWFRYVRQAIEEEVEARRPARAIQARPRPVEPDLPVTLPDDIEMIREIDIRFGMGDGQFAEEFPEVGQFPFNRGFRRALTSAPVESLFVARGDGDSMMPTLINDDMVLIDQTQKEIRQSDRIWALRIEDAGLIKRVRVVPGGGYELLSDNPMIPPQPVSREQIAVIGRVIWVGRRL
jgi:phage repressor protein C with HTH and peptisase S24 domain